MRFFVTLVIASLLPSLVIADPITATIVGAAISGGLAAASGAVVLGLTGTALGIAVFATNVALGFISSSLQPKPKIPNLQGFSSEAIDRLQQFRQPIASWRKIYGEVRVSGPLTFIETTDSNKDLHLIVTIASHEVDGLGPYFLNDEVITEDMINQSTRAVTAGRYSGQLSIFKSLGNEAGGVQPFPELVTATTGWTNNHTQTGRAKLYFRFTHDVDVYPNGIPNISVWVRGRKVADPRSSSTLSWTTNPPLAIRDYMVTSTVDAGMGVTTLEFDDTFTNSAANASEEIVSTKAIAHTVISVDTTNDEILLSVGSDNEVCRFQTGDRVKWDTTGSAPGGLTINTDFFMIVETQRGHVDVTSRSDTVANPDTAGFLGGVINSAILNNSLSNSTTGATNFIVRPKVKLATTYANAVAGTAINITTTGTGSQGVGKTGEPRYTLNGVIEVDRKPKDILDDMLTSMVGRLTYTAGVWRLRAGAFTQPSLLLDEGDIISPIELQTKASRRERFNSVKGIYVSPLNLDQPADYPPVTNSTFISEDNGEQRFREFDLPFTTRPHTAMRLAKIELERHRQMLNPVFICTLKALQVEAGDVVQITNSRFGWITKAFEIVEWELIPVGDEPVLGVKMSLRETDSSVFDFNSGEETRVDPAPNSNLPNAFDISDPSGLTIVEELYDTRTSSGVKARAIVIWNESETGFVDHYVLQIQQTEDKDGNTITQSFRTIFDGNGLEHQAEDLEPGKYNFQVKAVNQLGVSSNFIQKLNIEVLGLLTAPQEPQNFTILAIGGLAQLRWDLPSDLDVRIGGVVRIRHHDSQDETAIWNNARKVGDEIPGLTTTVNLPLIPGTYLAKTRDSSGVFSSAAASQATKQATVISFTTFSTIVEQSAFTGTFASTVKDGNIIKLTSGTLIDDYPLIDTVDSWDEQGGIAEDGTYDFAVKFDFGSVVTRRLTSKVKFTSVNITDLIDSRLSLIDTWIDIDGDNTGQVDCQIWERHTDDNPITASAGQFSPYNRLESGEFTVRGFQFQARLSTEDTDFNVHVSTLEVTADTPN